MRYTSSFALLLLLAVAPAVGHAAPLSSSPSPSTCQSSQRSAVIRAVKREMAREGLKNTQVTSVDVRSGWALVKVQHPAVDPATVLLRKRGATWRVLTYGTALQGTGRQFGAPRSLWRRWGL